MSHHSGAVGIAVCSAILNSRTNFHFLALASHLTSANDTLTKLMTGVTHRYATQFGSGATGHLAALKALWLLTYREASTMAYADAFLAIGVCFAIATMMVPLMKKVAAGPAPSAGAH